MVKACGAKKIGNKEYRCFFELALQVIGGKWKPIIVYQLGGAGVLRFGELKRSVTGVSERMLIRQLRELESDGLINRKVYQQVPPKVEYSLLPFGVRLLPILSSMREWGVAYERHLIGSTEFTADIFEDTPQPEIAAVYRQQFNDYWNS